LHVKGGKVCILNPIHNHCANTTYGGASVLLEIIKKEGIFFKAIDY